MKNLIALCSVLFCTFVGASPRPTPDPIFLSPTNQNDFGISVTVSESSTKSYSISITVPLEMNKGELSGISLHSRSSSESLTIPIHYTKHKKTISNPDNESQMWISKHDKLATSQMLIPKEWIKNFFVHISFWNQDYVLYPEAYLIPHKNPNQQVDPIVTTPVDKVEAQSTQGHP